MGGSGRRYAPSAAPHTPRFLSLATARDFLKKSKIQSRPDARRRTSRPNSAAGRRQAGFTLLETLVAIAIFGVFVTSILLVQSQSIKRVNHARNLSVAVGLGRCKMTEIEEQLFRDGFSMTDEDDSGECCEDNESPNISCSWSIEKPEFPEPDLGALDLDTDLEGIGALGKLAQAAQGQQVFTPDAGLAAVTEILGGGGDDEMGAMAAGGIGGIAAMVMSMVYPDLKILFEAATRRVTVRVTWTEGDSEYDFELVQWITNPRQAGIMGRMPGDALDAAESYVDSLGGSETSR